MWQIEEALCQIEEAAATRLHLNVVKWGLPISQEKLEMQILMGNLLTVKCQQLIMFPLCESNIPPG